MRFFLFCFPHFLTQTTDSTGGPGYCVRGAADEFTLCCFSGYFNAIYISFYCCSSAKLSFQVSVELAGFAAPGLSLLPVREQQCQEHFVPPPAPTLVPHLNLGEIKPGRGKGLAPGGFSQKTEGNKEQAAPSEPPTFHQFLLNSANLPQIESLQLLPGSRQLN